MGFGAVPKLGLGSYSDSEMPVFNYDDVRHLSGVLCYTKKIPEVGFRRGDGDDARHDLSVVPRHLDDCRNRGHRGVYLDNVQKRRAQGQ